MSNDVLARLAAAKLAIDTENEQEKEAWAIKDDLQADWALDKIRESEAEYRRFEMVVNDKIRQLVTALNTEREKMENETGFFKSKLAEYFSTLNNKKATKTQETYKLPSGRLVLKHKQPKIERDDDKLVPWLLERHMPWLVKTKKTADWANLKAETQVVGDKVISKQTGEVIDGVVAVPQSPEFTVEV